MSIGGDCWYVKLSDGDVHRVTLDQLDEAFQAGHIDANTMVLASGATQWTKLGALAGIDDEEEAIEAAEKPPAATYPSVNGASRGLQTQPAPSAPRGYAAPQPVAAPNAPHAAAATRQAAYAQPPSGTQPGNIASHPQVRPIAVHSPVGPASITAHSAPPISMPRMPLPNSLRPITMDFEDLGSDARKLRRGGSAKRWLAGLLVLSAIGGAGFVTVQRRPTWARPYLNRIGLHGSFEPAVAAAPPAIPAPPPTPPAPAPEPAAPLAPAAATATGDTPLSPHFTDRSDRLSDDLKQRPSESDKSRSKGHRGHAASGGSRHAPSGKGKSTTFTTGGSKYDPLNSSI